MSESRRTTVSELAMKLADRRSASASSASLKLNAKGDLMPEVTITAGTSQEDVDVMVEQATTAFALLLTAEKGEPDAS